MQTALIQAIENESIYEDKECVVWAKPHNINKCP